MNVGIRADGNLNLNQSFSRRGAAAAAAITLGTTGYAVALVKQPSSSQQMLQKDRDPPPGDAQTLDKRGERAMSAAPQRSTGEVAYGTRGDMNASTSSAAGSGVRLGGLGGS